MKNAVGLYLHLPFCRRKCAYCDFPSFPGREAAMSACVDKMAEEMQGWAARYPGLTIDTMYIGGGTPSLLPPPLMDRLLDQARRCFAFLPDAECTCECNPGTVTREFLSVLKTRGVNRLSFGVQAAQDRLLSMLGRIHSWAQAEESIRLVQAMGFRNYNLDIMLGLPGQTEGDVWETLEKSLALSPAHLSCYGLIVEDGTPLKNQVEAGAWQLPDEETERAEYEACRRCLSDHGFIQYEISNFALPGFACRHNVHCWQRHAYLGIGCAACGFLGDKRWRNPPDLDDYLAGMPPEITLLSHEDAMFESVMLGLRMMEGVSLAEFQRMHGEDFMAVYGARLQKPLLEGLVTLDHDSLRLTRRGMDLQNRVLVELL